MSLGRKKPEKHTICGEEVYIRALNGGREAVQIIEMLQKVGAEPSLIAEIGALLVVSCLCDEAGNALYSDAEAVRQEATLEFLTAFMQAALTASGLKDDAEEATKNLQAVQ